MFLKQREYAGNHHSRAESLIQRLDGVRRTGDGRWLARCPAHSDKSPSLSIRQLEDGRVLIHDFAGCDRGDILAAVGLTWAALYPPRNPRATHYRKAPPVAYADALKAVAAECWVVLVAGEQIERGDELGGSDMQRVGLAVQRIAAACEATGAWR